MRRISFGARTYNASIGRFDGVDALASIARRFSPYVYSNNNPLRFVDPDGMASEDFAYSDGYGNLSVRNSTGSISVNGKVDVGDDDDKPKPQGIKQTQEQIVNIANSYDKSTKYAKKTSIDDFGINLNKCNKFVCDVLEKAGIDMPKPNGNWLKRILGLGSPITAGQWANPNYKIDGWEIVTTPQAGDIVALKGDFRNATGHVAIMISEREAMGASEFEVHKNDFGYSPHYFEHYPRNNGYVYRRYVGKSSFSFSEYYRNNPVH